MILENDYPPDIRLEKEADALTRAGHSVHLLALDFDRRPRTEAVHDFTLHRIGISRTLHNKLHPTLLALPFYRGLWRSWIDRYIREVKPEILTVHDLPLAGVGLSAGRRVGIPVVLDLHENFPAAIESWGFDRGFLGRIFYDLARWRRYEREATRAAAGVIVVVDEAVDRLHDYGLPSERIEVIMNTERSGFGASARPVDPGGDLPLRLLYIGGLGPHRGLETAIRGVARMPSSDAAVLRLVGDGRIRPRLEALVRTLGVSDRVTFAGWVPSDAVASEIAASHVGLVPHARSDHTETTIPHKLFQYMTLGRPVLVSDCRPLARVVSEAACGFVHASGDDAMFAARLEELMDPAIRRDLGEAGRRATRGSRNWEAEGERLVTFYDRMLAARRA